MPHQSYLDFNVKSELLQLRIEPQGFVSVVEELWLVHFVAAWHELGGCTSVNPWEIVVVLLKRHVMH